MSTNNSHFAAELRATADALRHAREQVRFLQQKGDPAVAHYSAGFTITAYGREVAGAIDAVANG